MFLTSADQTLIDLALSEDLGTPYCDATTSTLFKNINGTFNARIISKNPEPIIVCGLPVVHAILQKITDQFSIQSDYQDGQPLAPGATLLTISAHAQHLLMAERTTLNFLQHLCAIATTTARFVKAVAGTKIQILDTRKTLPGMRHLDKYAVACGGGVNHRIGLYDAMMVKDTHIDLLGGIAKALALLPNKAQNKLPVIVEVRSLEELETTIKLGCDKITRVLLDNMSAHQLAAAVTICRGIFPTEASGNIDLNNIMAIAQTGVDFASIGRITHSAGSVDLSMKCDF